MPFVRHQDYENYIPQKLIDKKLSTCPFCRSETPYWLMDAKNSRYYYRCSCCCATMSSEEYRNAAELDMVSFKVKDVGYVCRDSSLVGRFLPLSRLRSMAGVHNLRPSEPYGRPTPADSRPKPYDARDPRPYQSPVAPPPAYAPKAEPVPTPWQSPASPGVYPLESKPENKQKNKRLLPLLLSGAAVVTIVLVLVLALSGVFGGNSTEKAINNLLYSYHDRYIHGDERAYYKLMGVDYKKALINSAERVGVENYKRMINSKFSKFDEYLSDSEYENYKARLEQVDDAEELYEYTCDLYDAVGEFNPQLSVKISNLSYRELKDSERTQAREKTYSYYTEQPNLMGALLFDLDGIDTYYEVRYTATIVIEGGISSPVDCRVFVIEDNGSYYIAHVYGLQGVFY